ncbi:MAG: hypothetical protein IJB31_03315 [Akkermansia sp.]|nr:hypothetical protein [Akkermansia sp.]
MQNRRFITLLLLLCAAAFVAAVWGSVNCGMRLSQPDLAAEDALHLRRLIYFHFAVAQITVVGGLWLIYLRHRRWRRNYLLISYNDKGRHLNPPGIRMPSGHVYRCSLSSMEQAKLPPANGVPTLVYPMFMLSGQSSGPKLEQALQNAYKAQGAEEPEFFYQPVLGASPWLARAAAKLIREQLSRHPKAGVLVVAHGSQMPEPPPEPSLFCRRLRNLLPGTEIALGYFNQTPEAAQILAGMQSQHVLLLPFLLTEGIHTGRDLPTPEQAAACNKSLTRLPVVANLL